MSTRSFKMHAILDHARAFLTPLERAHVPELEALFVRGARALSALLLALAIVVGAMQLASGMVDPVRASLYSGSCIVVWTGFLMVLRTRWARPHAERFLFVIHSIAAAYTLLAAWASLNGTNPFAPFVFVFPVSAVAFAPMAPGLALALGVEIGILYAIASVVAPFTPMTPLGEAFCVATAFGLAGALASQWQRHVLGELYRARSTAERQAHELAFARDRALEAARVKTQFLANMSHEIRTPMTAILGFTEVLAQELRKGDCSEEASDAIDTVHRNGAHLLRLLDDILDLSRLEVSGVKLEKRACAPDEVVADVVHTFEAQAAAKGLLLTITREEGAARQLVTDPLRLGQIVSNLVDNAIKFTAQGHVQVRIVPRTLDDAPGLAIEVSDTGMGMRAEEIDRVFEAFVQGDTSHTRRFGGTGLGLAISRRLADRLGGRLEVQSEQGQGSTFTLLLRAPGDGAGDSAERASEATSAPRARAPSPSEPTRLSGRVLLAEDGLDNQRLVSLFLRKAGAEVEVAANGRIAVDRVLAAEQEGRPFDLVLMDMQMPEMDGYEATRQLRDTGYEGAIVALTAHAMVGDSDRCLQAGCDGYLSKPISRDLLVQVANEFIRRKLEP